MKNKNTNPTALLDRWIGEALTRRATDLYLMPGEPPLMRIADAIERADAPAVTREETAAIAEAAIGRERLDSIGPAIAEIATRNTLPEEANARLSIARAQGDVTLSITLLPREIFRPEQLAIPDALLRAATSPWGLVVIAGPTGSGMQTVAYSLIEHLNSSEARHIATSEDPVRVRFTPKKSMIQQREVGIDVPDGFSGIRAAVRQDADVILVNELRSVEELQAALAAADSNRLVIAVLHIPATPDQALRRLIDVIPEDIRPASRRSLARALRCVSAQRLLPARDPARGRVAAYGLLVPDAETRRAIEDGSDWRVRTTPPAKGSITLPDAIRHLASTAAIAPDTARQALAEFEE